MNTQEVKIGNYIKGQYKYGCIQGIVTKVLKNTVTIAECRSHYDTVTVTKVEKSVTRNRISDVYESINDAYKNIINHPVS